MGWKDKAKDLAQKGQELKAEYDRRQAQRADQASQGGWEAPAPGQLVPRQATFARVEISRSASLSLWRLRRAM